MSALEAFVKKSASPAPSSPVVVRPVATNARVKAAARLHGDMYLSFVNNALAVRGEPYAQLLARFALHDLPPDAPSPTAELKSWLQALAHVVSRLDQSHRTLVEAIVRMPWPGLDASFVRAHSQFIGILVSARPEYLSLVLDTLAHGLTYAPLPPSLPHSPPVTRGQVYDRIHALLQHLLTLVPTLPSTLLPLLARAFPHKRLPRAHTVAYARNLLEVASYAPELHDRILSLVVDRALQIDVEIQVEIEELEEAAAEAGTSAETAFELDLDPFEVVVGQEGGDEDEDEKDDDGGDDADGFSDMSSDVEGELDLDDLPTQGTDVLDVPHIRDMVGKLDALLDVLFSHINSLAHPTPTPSSPRSTAHIPISPSSPVKGKAKEIDPEETEETLHAAFFALLAIFDRSILRTFKSRHTQFLLFNLSHIRPLFSEEFLGSLAHTAFLPPSSPSQTVPAVTRAAAAGYLGSFVSRAKCVDGEGARRAVRIVCYFLEAQCEAVEKGTVEGAPAAVTYAACQALFLVFCFRWRELKVPTEEGEEDEGEGEGKWMPELDVIPRLLGSALNPLQVCAAPVVEQFAHVSRASGFAYIYPLLAQARLHPLPTSTRERLLGELGTFFPFDPYRLPRSARWVEDGYREWSEVAVDGDEDDEEEDGGEDDEKEEEEEELGASFGGMSISPAVSAALAMSVSVG
ncbi:RNA polymerase I-specific transcription initiation factor RRN3 [Peniophora sp. CONT]|nr:RNA polymerase I-specific transcription initiation factor RRN3 [Peniophora sp. CONT]